MSSSDRIRTSHTRLTRSRKDKETILAVCRALVGMAVTDLTSAERTIFDALKLGGWLKLDKFRKSIEWDWNRLGGRGDSKEKV